MTKYRIMGKQGFASAALQYCLGDTWVWVENMRGGPLMFDSVASARAYAEAKMLLELRDEAPWEVVAEVVLGTVTC